MREIKFRGKRDDTGEWIYWNGVNGHGLKYNYPLPETIGQSTGLFDKNGKEIYEGDIVKDEKGIILEIYRNPALPQIEKRSPKFNYGYPLYGFALMEVIGNIHDNPELLEVDK